MKCKYTGILNRITGNTKPVPFFKVIILYIDTLMLLAVGMLFAVTLFNYYLFSVVSMQFNG